MVYTFTLTKVQSERMLYKAMQNLCARMLWYYKTWNVRWLLIERTVGGILLHYASLNSYFQSEDAPKSTNNGNGVESEWVGAERLKKAFDDRLTEVYL